MRRPHTEKRWAGWGFCLAAVVMAFWHAGVCPGECLTPQELARRLNAAFVQTAEEVSRSVVVIAAAHWTESDTDEESNLPPGLPEQFRRQLEQERERLRRQMGPPRPRQPVFDSHGSGVVLDPDGYILTSRHVVQDAARIRVRFKDDPEWHEARLRGEDPQSDVAVIKVDAPGKTLVAARLGDSDKVRVGEYAIAIGAPFDLDYTVTFGHISAKGRAGLMADESMDQDFLQTDANINPGNSGGPLVNISGEVIGINTLVHGTQTGIGFAIPINLAADIARHLIREGRYVRPWLGMGLRALRDFAEYRPWAAKLDQGLVVTAVQADGPAARAGLDAGDIIVRAEDQPVSTVAQLKRLLRTREIGQPIRLDVMRFGRQIECKVRTQPWPEPPKTKQEPRQQKQSEMPPVLGLAVKELPAHARRLADGTAVEGVLVARVQRGSLGERAGLREADVITAVNLQPVKDAEHFRSIVKALDWRQSVLFQVQRVDRRLIVVLPPQLP